jgi:hypothetical protein
LTEHVVESPLETEIVGAAVADECNHSGIVPFAAGKNENGEFQPRITCHTQLKTDNTAVRTRKIPIVVIISACIKVTAKRIDSRMGPRAGISAR